jgi:uncharacterized protein
LFPVDLLLRERFDSISKVRLKFSILFIHDTADLRIPFEMSERLHEAAPALVKRLVLIHDGGHSSSANVGRRHYFEAMQTFVKEAKNY